MAQSGLKSMVRYLQKVSSAGEAGASDAALLERFVRHRDESAFELLIWRHSRMVYSVCRRVLGHTQDAEDAFQATFLVLVRKARSIQKRSALASWLYKVAYRTALRAKSRTPLAKGQNGIDPDRLASPASDEALWKDLQSALDDEIGKLPPRYRAAFVLCCLEGKTNEEAAREMGCPPGTIQSRLSRARALLRARLTRRGLTLSTGTLAAVLAQQAGAAVPPSLLATTLQSSLIYAGAALCANGGVSATITSLTEGVLKTMFLTKVKIAAIALLTLGLLGGGAGVLVYPSLAQEQNDGVTRSSGAEPNKQNKPRLAAVFQAPQPVGSVAFSPDAKWIVSGDWDGAVRLWDVATGKQLRQLPAHSSEVTSLAFAPDGKSLVSSGKDGNLILWDAASGKKLFQFNNNGTAIHSLVISPDGKTVVFAANDSTIHLLHAASGREVMRLQGPRAAVASLAVSPDGRYIVRAGRQNRSVIFWDAATGKKVRELPFRKTIAVLCLSPDGRRLVVGAEDGALQIVDVASGRQLRTFKGHKKVVAAVAFSPNGELLATGGKDKTIRLWDVQTAVQIHLGVHKGPVTSLAFSPDGKYLVTGSKDRTVKLWIVIPVRSARIIPASADRLSRLVQTLIERKKTDRECIEALYLATLARFPTAGEKKAMQRQLADRGKKRREALANIVFALTTSREFSSHMVQMQKRDPRTSGR